jgi:hypothetical protein
MNGVNYGTVDMRNNIKKYITIVAGVLMCGQVYASKIFIPMDADNQTNHLKAYGVAYAALKAGMEVDWMLNYEGGSFCMT